MIWLRMEFGAGPTASTVDSVESWRMRVVQSNCRLACCRMDSSSLSGTLSTTFGCPVRLQIKHEMGVCRTDVR